MVKMSMLVFWLVTSRGLVGVYYQLWEKCKLPASSWLNPFNPEDRGIAGVHGVVTHKTSGDIFTLVRTSDLSPVVGSRWLSSPGRPRFEERSDLCEQVC
jgi:hypothetical protein